MLDTVKLRSPYVDEDVARAVESALETRSGIDNATGVLIYEFTSGQLAGSFDHRISVVVRREEWVSHEGRDGRKQTVLEPCRPFIEIEGSVHKAMAGHNVYGGPEAIGRSCVWLVAEIGRRLDIWLPYGGFWTVRRIDWAECFDLGAAAVGEYIWSLSQASYPKRKPVNHGRQSVYFAGRSTMLKFYAKGPEFDKRDRRRLYASPDSYGRDWVDGLAGRAARYMRVEVGIKAPLLDKAYGGAPLVENVSVDWVYGVWLAEVLKVLREGKSDMRIVRRAAEVRDRLYGLYGTRQAAPLYATWMQLAALGEDQVKCVMTRPTFYRHRSLLVAAGVSWRATDVKIIEGPTIVPLDFAPTLNDARRVVELDPRVAALMASAA